MKAVFMGTPDFAVPTLQKMVDMGIEITAVVTQPDKAKGRGKKVIYSPVKECALAHDLPVYQPVRIKKDPEFIQTLRDMAPDVIVVVAFGQILPKEVLDIPRLGCVNVHASLLPKFRGAAPIQWAIIDGEKVTGVTTMLMDVGLDTGDMLLKTEVSVDAKETGGSLHDKLAAAGGELLERTLIGLEAGTIVPEKQDDSQAGEYARMLDKELGHIDFNQPAVVIERLIRGLNPWPSAYTYIDGKTLKIWEAEVLDRNYGCEYGEVAEVTRTSLIIQTICALHGPILKENLGYYLDLYNTWSSYGVESEGVVIAYTSVYGNTKKAVELLADKLTALGCPKVTVTDLARDDMAEAVEDAFRYGKLVLATTTYNGDIFPFMKTFIEHLTERGYRNRTIGLIENGSWAPTAAKTMLKMFEGSKNLTFTDTTVTIKSAVNTENEAQIAALAEELCK